MTIDYEIIDLASMLCVSFGVMLLVVYHYYHTRRLILAWLACDAFIVASLLSGFLFAWKPDRGSFISPILYLFCAWIWGDVYKMQIEKKSRDQDHP